MTLLDARTVSVSLGAVRVLDSIDLQLEAGEVLGLVGPNGAGKTTLLRALANLLPVDHGEIRVQDTLLRDFDRRALAQVMAYLPQGGNSQWPITVETLVMLGRLPHRAPWGTPGRRDYEAVERALAACDVIRFRDRPATQLSGGERARVLLARVLCSEPRVLLVDEPVAGLDPGHQLDVMEKLVDLAASGTGIILVVHDLSLAARFCDRIVLLHGKQVAAQGDPDRVLSPGNLARYYGIRAYHATTEGHRLIVPMARAHE